MKRFDGVLTNLERTFCTYGLKREDMTSMMRMSCCLRCWQNHTRRLQKEGAWNTDQFKGGIWEMGEAQVRKKRKGVNGQREKEAG